MLLVNAVYLLAAWESPFDAEKTEQKPFYYAESKKPWLFARDKHIDVFFIKFYFLNNKRPASDRGCCREAGGVFFGGFYIIFRTAFPISFTILFQLPQMHKKYRTGFYEDRNVQVLRMKYKQGDIFMYILLPQKRFGLEYLLESLDGPKLNSLFWRTHQNADVTVKIEFLLDKISN